MAVTMYRILYVALAHEAPSSQAKSYLLTCFTDDDHEA